MSRRRTWLSVMAASAIAIVVTAVAALIWLASDASAVEVGRVPSPQGELDAVLVETNGGATTSFGYGVFVVPSGARKPTSPAAYLYGAGRNSNAYGVNLRWVSPSELQVEFETAKSATLEQPVVAVSGRTIRITLRPGVTDSTAPPGGMEYNAGARR
jgi:hypothetical protein